MVCTLAIFKAKVKFIYLYLAFNTLSWNRNAVGYKPSSTIFTTRLCTGLCYPKQHTRGRLKGQ